MSIIDIAPVVEKPARQRTPSLGRMQKIGIALAALWILTSVYLVAPEQQAVVTRFGAVVEPRVMPGIHLSLPWPIDVVSKLKVQQLQRLVVGGDIPDGVLGRTQPLQSQWITGDQNIINMRVVVQYSVSIPSDSGGGARRLAKAHQRLPFRRPALDHQY
jgi:regulator of protease activity HflC (stomatin/prohibitin superfamily)